MVRRRGSSSPRIEDRGFSGAPLCASCFLCFLCLVHISTIQWIPQTPLCFFLWFVLPLASDLRQARRKVNALFLLLIECKSSMMGAMNFSSFSQRTWSRGLFFVELK